MRVYLILVILMLLGCQTNTQPKPDRIERNSHSKPLSIREIADKLTQVQAISRKQRLSNIEYTLDIDLFSSTDSLNGVVEIEFLLNSNKDDLSIDFSGGEISTIRVNSSQQDIDYNGYFIVISADSLKLGVNRIFIKYSHRYDQDGTGLHKFIDPEDGQTYLYSYLWPYYANRLFPNFDQPNLKATYEMTVRANSDWQVVTSVLEDQVVEEKDSKVWHFPRSKKFSSYIFSLHAGPYKVWQDKAGDIPIRLMARQTMSKYVAVEEWFDYTKAGFKHFQDYFEIDYPFDKYDQLIVPDFNIGAMENVAAVTFAEHYYVQRGSSSRFQRQLRAMTILHEMAHMWFGNLVTKDWWNGLWLNESFATLMASIAVFELPEFKDQWHGFYLNVNLPAINADNMVSTHPIELQVTSTNDFFSVFDTITYEKGASVLNQLSHYVGQENFRKAVADYLKFYSWKNTELKDFIDFQAKQSGLELTSWAKKWLYQSGVNRVAVDFSCQDGKIEHFTVNQSKSKFNSTLRAQRLQLALFNIQANTIRPYFITPILIKGKQNNISQVKGMECPDLVYPNYQGWGFAEVELDRVSMKKAQIAIELSDDPLFRSMIWTSVLNHKDSDINSLIKTIADEDNDRIIDQVLDSFVKKLNLYQRQGNDNYKDISEKLESMLWKQLSVPSNNISTQIIRFEMFIKIVRSSRGQAHLVELLENKKALPGFVLNQDHRWTVIKRLAVLDHELAGQYLSKEKKSDPTDGGRLAAIAVESSLPDVSIKKKWLAIFMDNENPLPLSSQRWAMENLFPANQYNLQQQLLEQMLNALAMINKSRDNYYQRSYAANLFLGVCNNKGLRQMKSALNKDQIGTTLYRFLSENIQKAQECLEQK